MAEVDPVLFVCLHGSAKSLTAEYFNRLSAARHLGVRATSAGVEPDETIPPKVMQGLLADGIEVGGRRPRGIAPADLASASRIVTFGCDLGDAPTGVVVERWNDIPLVSEDFQKARDVIVARLPRSLDDCAKT
jgi:protein-tyrosine-phosphatase